MILKIREWAELEVGRFFAGAGVLAGLFFLSGCMLQTVPLEQRILLESNKRQPPAWAELPVGTVLRTREGLRYIYLRNDIRFLRSGLIQTERLALDACYRLLNQGPSPIEGEARQPLPADLRQLDRSDLSSALKVSDIYYVATRSSQPGSSLVFEIRIFVDLAIPILTGKGRSAS